MYKSSCSGAVGEPQRYNRVSKIALLLLFAVLLADRFNEWWCRHRYQYADRCLRVFLQPLAANCGSGNEARAHVNHR